MKLTYLEIDGLPYVTDGQECLGVNIRRLNEKLEEQKSISSEILHRLYGRTNVTLDDLKAVLDGE